MAAMTSSYELAPYFDWIVLRTASVCETLSPCVHCGPGRRCPLLSKPFCDRGAPCRSMMTLMPVCLAQPIALSRYGAAPCTNGSPYVLKAQYQIGIRTTLKPDALVSAMKPRVGLYAPSISSSGSSTASEQTGKDITIRIPSRPMGKDGKALAQFVCPYCSTAQFITEERQWK